MPEPIIIVEDLSVSLDVPGEPLVVSGLGLELYRGRTFALLGESGCGKTMLALALMQLLPSNIVISGGRILFDGTDLVASSGAKMRSIRG